MTRLNQQHTLPDGRRLGYDEHGEVDGYPIFYFHGTPSARVEWNFFGTEELIQKFNLRVIAIDRPGMGLSDFQHNRRISDWPKDVTSLADHLRIDRFTILGYSGGTPYALVCANQIPERLHAVGVVAVVGPFDQPGATEGIHPGNLQFLEACRDKPLLGRLIQRVMAWMARLAPEKLIIQAMTALPPPDQAIMAQPKGKHAFLNMIQEGVRRGARGPQVDSALMVSPWEFNITTLKTPVHMWQGVQDQNAPIAMARYLAAAIPTSHLMVYPEEGHLSIMVNHAEEVFQTLRPELERS